MSKRKAPKKDEKLPEVVEAELVQMGTYDRVIEMAINSNADLDKIERFMNLKDRHEEKEAKKEYNAAIVKFKSENIKILKTATVDFTNRAGVRTTYNHAELGEIVNQITERLATCGLFHSWVPEQTSISEIKVTCKITHAAGHSESVSMMAGPDTSGGKNAIQGIASSKSYLERYTLGSILGLAASEDNDGRGDYRSDGSQLDETLDDENEFMIQEKFDALYPKWEKLIQNGKHTHESLLNFQIENGNKLAPHHVAQIRKVTVTKK